MPAIKKVKIETDRYLVNEYEAMHALIIFEMGTRAYLSAVDADALNKKIRIFQNSYDHSHLDTLGKIREVYPSIDNDIRVSTPEELYKNYLACFLSQFDKEPVKLLIDGNIQWVFKEYVYQVKGHYSDDQIRLLILEDFDKERKYFEKLKAKFDEAKSTVSTFERPRIPESVRVEVWRRDSGKCARCGSREKLEYDHIVPISRGGSNTARNIELLCEKCNRSKSNNVV